MYNLIVLDINMPVLDGLQACASIKKLFSIEKGEEFEAEHGNQIYSQDNDIQAVKMAKKMALSYCPLIVANSADINEDITRDCLEVGFDKIFCQLSLSDVKEKLLPEICQRSIEFQEKID